MLRTSNQILLGFISATALLLFASSTAAQSGGSGGAPASAADPQQAAKWLESAFGKGAKPEAVEMLIAIANGSQMGPSEGWFHPG
ncbi:MAG TPA: hypothetical protein VMP01_19860, partial [Pirellulaceae bacterium]|nr:hypothetical protein [Pirellulaceae bacterium]